MTPGDIFAFGPFTLDTSTRRLTKGQEEVALPGRQLDLLQLMVVRAGQVLSKDALIEAAWPDVAVTDNSLEQAISNLRRTLSPEYIQTQARRGYRFAADVTKVDRRHSDADLDALLAPHRAFVEGRAALETLDRDEILRARGVFATALAQVPDLASAHVGLANACVMQFEMTRAEPMPDVALLADAMQHAREACRIDPSYGEGWATLGLVLDRTGRHTDAVAAARRAVSLEPDNWRHHLRLGYTSWGEERLREARRTLALFPGFAIAHWLAATVLTARQAIGEAERELDAGLAAQETTTRRFSGVALHWLRGLLALAADHHDEARAHFAEELRHEHSGQLYARECCANTWYALGALEAREGRTAAADAAFGEALARTARHPLAAVARLALRGAPLELGSTPGAAAMASAAVDRALAVAVYHSLSGGATDQAAADVNRALADAPPGSAGWILPVEPVLRVSAHPGTWATALATLRHRAA